MSSIDSIKAEWVTLSISLEALSNLIDKAENDSQLTLSKLYQEAKELELVLQNLMIYIVNQKLQDDEQIKAIFEEVKIAYNRLQQQIILLPFDTSPKVETPYLSPTHVNVNLPKLNLFIFKGKHEEWPAFINQFDLNTSLQDTQRLQYLKSTRKSLPRR